MKEKECNRGENKQPNQQGTNNKQVKLMSYK